MIDYLIDVLVALLGKIDGAYTWREVWLIITRQSRFIDHDRWLDSNEEEI